jgi:hypothetical protein
MSLPVSLSNPFYSDIPAGNACLQDGGKEPGLLGDDTYEISVTLRLDKSPSTG